MESFAGKSLDTCMYGYLDLLDHVIQQLEKDMAQLTQGLNDENYASMILL
jgi:hypothetical protein